MPDEAKHPDGEDRRDLAPDLRCYYHPERAATSQCDTCGDYLCEECTAQHEGDYLCPRCHRLARRDEPVTDPRAKPIGRSLFAMGLIMFFWPIVEAAISGVDRLDLFPVAICYAGYYVGKGRRRAMRWALAFMIMCLFMLLLMPGILSLVLLDMVPAGSSIKFYPPVSTMTKGLIVRFYVFNFVFLIWACYNAVMLFRLLRDTRLLRNADAASDGEKNDA